MFAERLEARDFRNLTAVEVALPAGIGLLWGPNGAGKTNLLEALYFGLVGASWRTSNAREMIAYGESLARAEVEVRDGSETRSFLASYARDEGAKRLVDGSPRRPGRRSCVRPSASSPPIGSSS